MNKNNKFIFIFLFIHTHIFVFYFFIFWAGLGPASSYFWVGPSSSHMGWLKPVTRLGKKKLKAHVKWIHACMNTVLVTIQFEMRMQKWMKKRAYLLLEIEDACSADDDSRLLLLCLPSVLTCLYFPFVFSVAFKITKMMLACCEFSLTDSGSFLCLQGRKQWKSQYFYLSCSFTFPSLFCVLFFCSVFLLCLSSIFGFSSLLGFSSPFIEIQPKFFIPC